MKNAGRLSKVTLIVLAVLWNAIPGRAEPSESIQQVKESFARYVEAWTHSDLAKLSEVYATDEELVVYWPDPFRPFLVKGWSEVRKGLEHIFANMGQIDLEFTLQQINVYGDIAVLTSNWKWLTPFGVINENNATGRCTLVFQRRGSRWVIIHEHSSWRPPSIETK
jgi:uncharacterized protein (TIGR02246 family)